MPSVMKRERVDAVTERWTDERGKLEISSPRPGMVLQRFEGHACAPMADAIISRLDAEIVSHGTIVVFDDWAEATGYDSEVRLKLTEWTGKHETQVRETHVLLRSKLIAMGMAVANLALGGHLRTYTSRTAFDAARVRAR
jgi:hypothetical protein